MSDIKCIGIDLGTSTTIVSYIDEFGYTKYISQGSCNFQNSVVNVSCINGESFKTGVGELEDVNGVLYATETKRIIGKRKDNQVAVIQENEKKLDYKIVANQENQLATCRFVFENGKFLDISPELVAQKILENVTVFRKDQEIPAVITVPAEFGVFQKNATLEAARKSNIKVLKLLPEPSAAAYYYFKKDPQRGEGNYLVFDFGGGTLDISLIQVCKNQDGQLEFIVKWVEGDSTLGGVDVDNLVFQNYIKPVWFGASSMTLEEKSLTSQLNNLKKEVKHKLSAKARVLKETLCSTRRNVEYFSIEIPENDLSLIISVNYEQFKRDCEEAFQKRVQTLISKFKELGCDINEVLMVGGSSLIPFVKDWVQDELPGVTITRPQNSDIIYIVSYGAAYLAHDLYQKQAIPITECLSRTIRIKEYQNNSLIKVLEKGTPLPCKKLLAVTNSSDETKEINLTFREGESEISSMLELLTNSIIKIDQKPASNHKICVECRVDQDGVFTVNVHDVVSRSTFFSEKFTFSNNQISLSQPEENSEMWEKLHELTEKVYFVKGKMSVIKQKVFGNTHQANTTLRNCETFVETLQEHLTLSSIEKKLEEINCWYKMSLT